jgi:FKBP-type peptidyl-prolyl cis-trans isomerase 2
MPDLPTAGNVDRQVQPGDSAEIRYLCRLRTGAVAASTDSVPEGLPLSNIFVKRKDTGPLTIAAARPEEVQPAKIEEPFEEEIASRLAGVVAGMREGESRHKELAPRQLPERDEKNYIVRLARVRTRPKEMKIKVEDYQSRTGRMPEQGQAIAFDPAFPGRVEAVTKQEVVIRFPVPAGNIIETPFGPGRVREEGQIYKVEIDAREGALTRMGGLIGRIVQVNDTTFSVDYRNSFGGETLLCDVTVDKIVDVKTASSGKGE